MFGNSDGQPYTTSGFNTKLRQLKGHAQKKAAEEGVEFTRFTLMEMRPAAVTDRVDERAKRSRTLLAIVAIAWAVGVRLVEDEGGKGNRIGRSRV